jgi:hypothetical protein
MLIAREELTVMTLFLSWPGPMSGWHHILQVAQQPILLQDCPFTALIKEVAAFHPGVLHTANNVHVRLVGLLISIFKITTLLLNRYKN